MKRTIIILISCICIFFSCQKKIFNSQLKNGLVAYYPFNGNTKDKSGNSNHGTNTGASLTKDIIGIHKKAYHFSEINSERIMCNNDPIGDDESVSVSAFVYPETPLHNEFSKFDNQYIVSTGAQTVCAGYFILWNNGKFWIGRKTNTLTCDTLFGSYQPSNWYHIAMTFNKNDSTMNVYINGDLAINCVAKSQSINNHKFKQLCIGVANTAHLYDNQWTFNGIIDQLRIYNRVLSQEEIKELYQLKE